MKICSFEPCEIVAKCKGLCNGHYHQVYRGEELRPLQRPRYTCSFDSCDRTHVAKGYCSRHYQQTLLGQEPSPIGNYRSDSVSTNALHTRIRAARGRAATYACIECGSQAMDWAYQYGCPNEQQSRRGPYTTDISMYQPMCRSCHRTFDVRQARSLRKTVQETTNGDNRAGAET